MAVLLGQSTTGGNTANSNSAGIAFAQRLTCLQSGTIDTLWVNIGANPGTAVTLHAAIYSDVAGVCTTRLVPEITQLAVFNQWNSITGFNLAVTAGTVYWIAWLPTGDTANYTDFATTGGTERDQSGLSTLPATYAFTGSNSNIANVYATGSTGGVAPRSPLLFMLNQGGLRRALALDFLNPPVPPVAPPAVQTTSQTPLVVTSPTPDFPGKTISPPARDGIVRSTPGPPTVVTRPTEPIPGHSLIFTGLDGLAPAGPGPLLVTRPTDPIPGTFVTRVGDPNAAPPSVPFTPTPLFITSPTPLPVPQTLIQRGTDDALQLNSPGPKPLVITSSAVVEGKTLLRKGTDDAIQIGTITPQPVVITARSVVPLPEVLIQQGGVTSTQVNASGQNDIVFGSTAIPTVSAIGLTGIVFGSTGVPTESATGTSTIIFNSTGTATTPGGISTFVSMRGANSAFVNVASATTDAPFTGGILPSAKAGQCINVLAVTFNADTAADTLVFNSKGAGAGTAITALFSNPINGSVVWPYTPVGWFTTNGGEGLTVTTTGASPTHVQIIFELINA